MPPDGGRLLVQEGRGTEEQPGVKHGAWAWDVETREARLVAEASTIERTFGWAKGGGLVVQAEGPIEGPPEDPRQLYTCGLLWVPRSDSKGQRTGG